MNAGLIISSIALGVSLAASAIKLFNWLIHSDPRVLIRAGRWLLFSLAVGSVPGLIALLMYERWALAMTLGAGMLIAPTVLNWRAILPRSKFRPMWPEGDPLDAMRGEFGQPPPSQELALRAAIVLEDYLAHAGNPEISMRIDRVRRSLARETQPPLEHDMAINAEEALEILGLREGASAAVVRALIAAYCSLSILIMAAQTISPPRSMRPRRLCWPRQPKKYAHQPVRMLGRRQIRPAAEDK